MISFHESNIKRAVKNIFLKRRNDVIVLFPHLGLGDNLVCIGLVRELVMRYPNVRFYYACPLTSFHTISWIYQDIKTIYPVPIENGREAKQLAGFFNAQLIFIGNNRVDIKRFDESFYRQHSVSFEKRWENTQVPPGLLSDILYNKLNPKGEPYILVCSRQSGDVDYQLKIDNPLKKKIIQVSPITNNLYDWVKLAFLSDEIHTIDTSFVHFVENIFVGKKCPQIFYHLVRVSDTEFTRSLPWNVIVY